MKNVPLRTFALLLIAVFARAQQAEVPPEPLSLEGQPVVRVEFRPTEQPLPRGELDRMLPLRVGEPLQAAQVRQAIERLYASGRFADIAVEATSEGSGVVLIFATQPNYFISRVSLDGENEPPNRNQLTTSAQLELGAPFHEDAIAASIARMQERLRANGLYQATIQHRVDTVESTEEASIYFDLNAGKRARFAGVQLTSQEPISLEAREQLMASTQWHRGIAFLPLPGWRTATESRVQSGVENLRRKLQGDDRLQARVTLERLDYDAVKNLVTPILSIDRGPVIEVRTTGMDIGKNRLRQLIPIYQERTVDRSLLLEGQRNLTEYLQSEGYFNASVRFTQSEPSPGRSVVEYQIDRGDRHKLRAITMVGNKYFDTPTLRERMYVQPASLIRFRSGRYSPRMLTQDVAAIRALYDANGFREAQVTSEVTEDPMDHTLIEVRVQVTEGQQWFVEALDIAGLDPEDQNYLRSTLRSTEGQPFSPANVAADRDAMLTYLFNNGYPDATFNWTQREGTTPQLVALHFVLTPGKRQYVRGVLVRGLETTSPSLVASRIVLKEGDPLSQSQIGDSQQRLYDLGIFAKVQTATQNPDGEEERKNVIFYADEARKYSFNLGFGAQVARIGGDRSSLSSPGGQAGFSPRASVGVSRINFLGLGHTVSLQTLASTLQRRALLNYLAPQFQGNPNLALTMSALFNDARDVRTFNARRWEGSVQLSQRFNRSDTAQLRFTYRRITVSNLQISNELAQQLSRPVRVGLVGSSLFRDRRDDPVDSHRGAYNSLDVALAAAAFGSQTSFTRVIMRNSTYHQFTREVTLARSLQFGYIGRMGGLPDIPLAERFFSGGASSHRGFPDNQAGPRDPRTGFPLGGSALFFHSTELRFPLIGDNLGGVVFHDMGNVFSNMQNLSFRLHQRNLLDFDYMVHAVGTGIRYRTPVGPIRVDVAYAPNTPRFFGFSGTRDQLLALPANSPVCAEGSPLCTDQRINRFQFHFSLGQTF